MVARINQLRISPAETAAVAQFGREVFVPGSKAQEGFQAMFACVNEEGQWIVVELYDTIEHMRATEAEGWYQQMAEAYGTEHFKGQIRRNVYEVALSEGIPGKD